MIKFILLDKKTGQEWTWHQLHGIDTKYDMLMQPRHADKFRAMLNSKKYTGSNKKFAYTIIGINYGGARNGAGRKTGGRNKSHLADDQKRHTVGVRLPGHLIVWLKNQDEPMGRIIEDALNQMRERSDPAGTGTKQP